MARAIDCGELEKRISSLARLARSDAQKSLLGRVLYIVENMPTLTPPNEWVRVDERLPENDGWYLVYAPEYWGHSKIYGLDGLAYSNFKHNYKVHWGIERGTGRGYPGIVTHWMPLPVAPTKEE